MKDGEYEDPWGTASIAGNGGGVYPSVCVDTLQEDEKCISAYDRYDPTLNGGEGGWDGEVDGGGCEIAYDWCADFFFCIDILSFA